VKHLKTDLGEVHRNRERMTMLTDNHPNIVKCFDSTLVEPYLLVQEYLAGGSLFDLLYNTGQTLTLCQQVKILLDVASAMRYLHAQTPCILHRDLKSSNVLLAKQITSSSTKPFAKVADFGLSRSTACSSKDMVDKGDGNFTVGVGTWRWMAPEVFDYEVAYDDKVDVFSFAILMYEVLERRLPYAEQFGNDDGSDPRICLYVMRGLRPELRRLKAKSDMPEVQSALVKLMEAGWNNEASCRPSFEELETQLSAIYTTLEAAPGATG